MLKNKVDEDPDWKPKCKGKSHKKIIASETSTVNVIDLSNEEDIIQSTTPIKISNLPSNHLIPISNIVNNSNLNLTRKMQENYLKHNKQFTKSSNYVPIDSSKYLSTKNQLNVSKSSLVHTEFARMMNNLSPQELVNQLNVMSKGQLNKILTPTTIVASTPIKSVQSRINLNKIATSTITATTLYENHNLKSSLLSHKRNDTPSIVHTRNVLKTSNTSLQVPLTPTVVIVDQSSRNTSSKAIKKSFLIQAQNLHVDNDPIILIENEVTPQQRMKTRTKRNIPSYAELNEEMIEHKIEIIDNLPTSNESSKSTNQKLKLTANLIKIPVANSHNIQNVKGTSTPIMPMGLMISNIKKAPLSSIDESVMMKQRNNTAIKEPVIIRQKGNAMELLMECVDEEPTPIQMAATNIAAHEYTYAIEAIHEAKLNYEVEKKRAMEAKTKAEKEAAAWAKAESLANLRAAEATSLKLEAECAKLRVNAMVKEKLIRMTPNLTTRNRFTKREFLDTIIIEDDYDRTDQTNIRSKRQKKSLEFSDFDYSESPIIENITSLAVKDQNVHSSYWLPISDYHPDDYNDNVLVHKMKHSNNLKVSKNNKTKKETSNKNYKNNLKLNNNENIPATKDTHNKNYVPKLILKNTDFFRTRSGKLIPKPKIIPSVNNHLNDDENENNDYKQYNNDNAMIINNKLIFTNNASSLNNCFNQFKPITNISFVTAKSKIIKPIGYNCNSKTNKHVETSKISRNITKNKNSLSIQKITKNKTKNLTASKIGVGLKFYKNFSHNKSNPTYINRNLYKRSVKKRGFNKEVTNHPVKDFLSKRITRLSSTLCSEKGKDNKNLAIDKSYIDDNILNTSNISLNSRNNKNINEKKNCDMGSKINLHKLKPQSFKEQNEFNNRKRSLSSETIICDPKLNTKEIFDKSFRNNKDNLTKCNEPKNMLHSCILTNNKQDAISKISKYILIKLTKCMKGNETTNKLSLPDRRKKLAQLKFNKYIDNKMINNFRKQEQDKTLKSIKTRSKEIFNLTLAKQLRSSKSNSDINETGKFKTINILSNSNKEYKNLSNRIISYDKNVYNLSNLSSSNSFDSNVKPVKQSKSYPNEIDSFSISSLSGGREKSKTLKRNSNKSDDAILSKNLDIINLHKKIESGLYIKLYKYGVSTQNIPLSTDNVVNLNASSNSKVYIGNSNLKFKNKSVEKEKLKDEVINREKDVKYLDKTIIGRGRGRPPKPKLPFLTGYPKEQLSLPKKGRGRPKAQLSVPIISTQLICPKKEIFEETKIYNNDYKISKDQNALTPKPIKSSTFIGNKTNVNIFMEAEKTIPPITFDLNVGDQLFLNFNSANFVLLDDYYYGSQTGTYDHQNYRNISMYKCYRCKRSIQSNILTIDHIRQHIQDEILLSIPNNTNKLINVSTLEIILDQNMNNSRDLIFDISCDETLSENLFKNVINNNVNQNGNSCNIELFIRNNILSTILDSVLLKVSKYENSDENLTIQSHSSHQILEKKDFNEFSDNNLSKHFLVQKNSQILSNNCDLFILNKNNDKLLKDDLESYIKNYKLIDNVFEYNVDDSSFKLEQNDIFNFIKNDILYNIVDSFFSNKSNNCEYNVINKEHHQNSNSFSNITELNINFKLENKYSRWCDDCFMIFNNSLETFYHLKKKHDLHSTSNLACLICEINFEDKAYLLQHMTQLHKACEMPYLCLTCGYKSSTHAQLITHFKQMHADLSILLCPYCLKTFVTTKKGNLGFTRDYYEHLLKHFNVINYFKCAKCRLTFVCHKDLNNHYVRDHSSNVCSIYNKYDICTIDKNGRPLYIQLKDPITLYHTTNILSTKVERLSIFDSSNVKFDNEHIISSHTCLECGQLILEPYHFGQQLNCVVCAYATICEKSYLDHMQYVHQNGNRLIQPFLKMNKFCNDYLYCLCGFESEYAVDMIHHMIKCQKYCISIKCKSNKQIIEDKKIQKICPFFRKNKIARSMKKKSIHDRLMIQEFVNNILEKEINTVLGVQYLASQVIDDVLDKIFIDKSDNIIEGIYPISGSINDLIMKNEPKDQFYDVVGIETALGYFIKKEITDDQEKQIVSLINFKTYDEIDNISLDNEQFTDDLYNKDMNEAQEKLLIEGDCMENKQNIDKNLVANKNQLNCKVGESTNYNFLNYPGIVSFENVLKPNIDDGEIINNGDNFSVECKSKICIQDTYKKELSFTQSNISLESSIHLDRIKSSPPNQIDTKMNIAENSYDDLVMSGGCLTQQLAEDFCFNKISQGNIFYKQHYHLNEPNSKQAINNICNGVENNNDVMSKDGFLDNDDNGNDHIVKQNEMQKIDDINIEEAQIKSLDSLEAVQITLLDIAEHTQITSLDIVEAMQIASLDITENAQITLFDIAKKKKVPTATLR